VLREPQIFKADSPSRWDGLGSSVPTISAALSFAQRFFWLATILARAFLLRLRFYDGGEAVRRSRLQRAEKLRNMCLNDPAGVCSTREWNRQCGR
jgi:hypothetical protein